MPKKGGPNPKTKVVLKNKTDLSSYLLISVFTVLIVFFSTCKIANEDDIFWHLSIGRYIVENKTVPSSDIFSYPTLGALWIPFEWGWDIMNYSLYLISGFTGISILNTIILLLIFSVIFYTLRQFSVGYTVIFFILLFFLFGIFGNGYLESSRF